MDKQQERRNRIKARYDRIIARFYKPGLTHMQKIKLDNRLSRLHIITDETEKELLEIEANLG